MPGIKGLFKSFLQGSSGSGGLVITTAAEKGGVGKTTTAINLAANLAVMYDQKVLIVDVDPQGHVSTALAGLRVGRPAHPISEILMENRPDISPAIVACSLKNLFVVPADRDLRQTETALSGRIGKEFKLAKALSKVVDAYDVIIVDSPPNLGNLTLNALVAATHVIVPVDMSPLAVRALENIAQTLDILDESLGQAPVLLGVLRTRYDKRRQRVNREVSTSLSDIFKTYMFDTVIPESTSVTRSQMEGKPLIVFDSKASASMAYMEFTREVLKRVQDERNERG